MKHGPCKTCLWWWDLYDTGERRCYRRASPFFHELTVDGCTRHEDSIARLRETRNGVKIVYPVSVRKEQKH